MDTQIIKKELSPIAQKVEWLQIKNADDIPEAVSLLSSLNKHSDAIETEKAKVMRPLLDAQKAERARWKPIETVLDSAITTLRAKMSTFQTEELARTQAQATKIAEKIGEGKGKIKFETALEKLRDIKTPDKFVKTEEGSVSFRTIKRFEVTDLSLVPKEYLLPNEPLIKDAMKKNKPIPGIRYYEEQTLANFR